MSILIKILAIETTTEACSAALMFNDKIINEYFSIDPRGHTKQILPMIHKLLNEAEITLKNLNLIAFGCGPGSFTGIRIGIGVAQSLALGANLPLIGISTLMTLAQGVWRRTGARYVLTAINARFGEIYWGQYYRQNNGIWLGENSEKIININKLTKIFSKLTGNWTTAGFAWKESSISFNNTDKLTINFGNLYLPSAKDTVRLAMQKWHDNKIYNVAQAKPNYLYNKII